MCGISGVFTFNKPTNVNRGRIINFLEQAMYVGSLRGRDGTGIFGVTRENNQVVRFAKRAIDGSMFGDSYTAQSILIDADDYMATVVHNRKGTMGGNSDDATHPFKIGKITLVHNGTLSGHRQLGGGNQLQSDSAAIAYALNRCDDPKTVLEELSGAFTLVWYNSETEHLHIARNEKRPLSIAFHATSDMMLFCSEGKMLQWLADRTDITIGELFKPAENTLYSWDISKANATVKTYTEEKFEGVDEWDDYSSYAGYASSCGTGAGNVVQHGNRGGDRPGQRQAGATSPPFDKAKSTSNRAKREEALEKYGIEVGDTIDFVAYDVGPKHAVSNMVRIEGLDPGGAFEVVCYVHWTAESAIMYQNLEGALCSGKVNTVTDTPQYNTWPVIAVGEIRKKTERFWKEGKDFTKSDHKPERPAPAVIQLPAPRAEGTVIEAALIKEGGNTQQKKPEGGYCPPSQFCTCTQSTRVKCISICNCCERQEIAAAAKGEDAIEGYVSQDNESVPSPTAGMDANTLVPCGYGMRRTLAHWQEDTADGCSNCACDLLDPEETYWTRDNSPLCYDCIEHYAEVGVFANNAKMH